MTYPTIWNVVFFVAVIAVFGMRYLLPVYFAEKGKNLVSKEDLDELTRKVEGVKTLYLSDLERLRFDLGRASLIHRARYVTEFRVYEEIWKCMTDVQRTVLALRPMLDYTDPNESDEKRRKRRMQDFADTFNATETAIWKNKFFYSAAVHQELKELRDLFYSEAILYQHGDPHGDPDYWSVYRKNIENISKKIDAVCEAIRQRLSGGYLG